MKERPVVEKIQRWCLRAIAVSGTVIFAVLVSCSWFRTKTLLPSEFFEDHGDMPWKMALIFAGVIATVCVAIKAERFLSAGLLHIMAVICAAGAVIFSLYLMHGAKAYAVADQWYVYDAACRLAEGNFDIQQYSGYYQFYAFQLNLAQIYEFLFRLTGSSGYEVIQVMHAICAGITVYMGFRIVRELFCRRAAELICLILEITFMPMYVYVLYIYGETLGTCCAMTAVWCFLKYNKCHSVRGILGYGIVGMLAAAVFYQARVALIVVWIAMMLIQLLITWPRRNYLSLAMTFSMLIMALLMSAALRSSMEGRTGVDLDKRMPAVLWIAMGMQDSIEQGKSPGSYNGYNVSVYVQAGMDKKASSGIAMEYLRERIGELITHPADAAAFFGRKIMNQWNEPTYGCFISTGFSEGMDEWVHDLYYGTGKERCLAFLNIYQGIVYFAVLLGFVRLVSGKGTPQEALIGLILIGEFLFSMMWEAKSRYVYPYVVIMIPFAAGSLMRCGDAVLRKIKRQEADIS
ncbi:MAG: glycosyltransferase family 39 protein [Blautia sp.]|nr:glycosyltransferase family 39 protein [Blautia sp.]